VLVSLTSTAPAQSGPPPPPPTVWSDALNFWPLERPPWSSVFGDPARGFTNLATAPSWDYNGTAISIDTNDVPAFLNLDIYESGWTNLIVGQTNGSLSFWYQANYTSVADGGTGPGDWAALLDIGAYTTNASAGCWLLTVDPSASNLVFIAQSEGANQFVFDAPIDLDAGDWHNICLTYTATNCCLYLEGQFATNAGPIACWPSAGQCLSNGFFVGSMSALGDYQCRGQMQYLETFDYPCAATQIPESSPRHPKNLPRISMQSRNAPKTPLKLQMTNPNSQWILPCTDAEFAEKKGKMIAFSAPSAALREMRAWGFWFRLTNITAYVPRNGDTILLWNVTNYVSHTYSSHPLKPTVPPTTFTPVSHSQIG